MTSRRRRRHVTRDVVTRRRREVEQRDIEPLSGTQLELEQARCSRCHSCGRRRRRVLLFVSSRLKTTCGHLGCLCHGLVLKSVASTHHRTTCGHMGCLSWSVLESVVLRRIKTTSRLSLSWSGLGGSVLGPTTTIFGEFLMFAEVQERQGG